MKTWYICRNDTHYDFYFSTKQKKNILFSLLKQAYESRHFASNNGANNKNHKNNNHEIHTNTNKNTKSRSHNSTSSSSSISNEDSNSHNIELEEKKRLEEIKQKYKFFAAYYFIHQLILMIAFKNFYFQISPGQNFIHVTQFFCFILKAHCQWADRNWTSLCQRTEADYRRLPV